MPAAEQVSGDNCFIDVQMWDTRIRRSDVLFLYPHPPTQSAKIGIYSSAHHIHYISETWQGAMGVMLTSASAHLALGAADHNFISEILFFI